MLLACWRIDVCFLFFLWIGSLLAINPQVDAQLMHEKAGRCSRIGDKRATLIRKDEVHSELVGQRANPWDTLDEDAARMLAHPCVLPAFLVDRAVASHCEKCQKWHDGACKNNASQ